MLAFLGQRWYRRGCGAQWSGRVDTDGEFCGKELPLCVNSSSQICRHGNFLQWGHAAAPSRMTPAGRNLFVNCIAYIHKFDGERPQ